MARFRYDRSSKWLIEHHGGLLLRLGGVDNLEAWRAAQAEVVQPRQLPDGLLEVRLAGQRDYTPFVLEVETYPDNATPGDVLDDIMLVYQDRRVLPDVLVVVLHPKGNVQTADTRTLRSPAGLTDLGSRWRVVPLWTIPATQLLATGEPGLMPWVPLTRIDGPPEPVLQQCRRVIDERARPQEHENLLAVTQVLRGLRYDDPQLLALFGGKEAMIESPVLQRVLAENSHKMILAALETRFGTVPADISTAVRAILDGERLEQLIRVAAGCPNLDAFREQLLAGGQR
jgi:predicted transposase YdaD